MLSEEATSDVNEGRKVGLEGDIVGAPTVLALGA
jgi:hypothetical protein